MIIMILRHYPEIVLVFICIFSFIDYIIASQIDKFWSFDADNDHEGWGKSTPLESRVEITVTNGDLKGILHIASSTPYIESPDLQLQISHRHYFVMRMLYTGSAKYGRILTKFEYNDMHGNDIEPITSWANTPIVKVVEQSNSLNDSYPMENTVDRDIYSYYLSDKPHGAYAVFDLGLYRLINQLTITSIGDNNSPKRCILQKSLTSGSGPFETVLRFELAKSKPQYNQFNSNGSHPDGPTEQNITFDLTFSRYWRVLFLDNYDGPYIGIREISFQGYDDHVASIDISLISSITTQSIGSNYHMYYIPLYTTIDGIIRKLRFEFICSNNLQQYNNFNKEAFAIDYISIIQAPEIFSVSGCLEKYSHSLSFIDVHYNVTTKVNRINNQLPLHYYEKGFMLDLPYSVTYDCPREGGLPITITGQNFGYDVIVYVNNQSCPIISYRRNSGKYHRDVVQCLLPSVINPINTNDGSVYVRVVNAQFPGLSHEAAYLSYRIPPPKLNSSPRLANIGSKRIDIVWNVPGSIYEQLTITGYHVIWFESKIPDLIYHCTVGNVTMTSIRGLQSNTEYVFAVAAISEGSYPINNANLPTDLYGRRESLINALRGEYSPYSSIIGTLEYDFQYEYFNANQTFNHSSVINDHVLNILGPTGQYGSEGSYGIIFIGDANIENCNSTRTCCDGYNTDKGLLSCATTYSSICTVVKSCQLPNDYVINNITRREVPSSLAHSNNRNSEISFMTVSEVEMRKQSISIPSSQCGRRLRLTGSEARLSGSIWYRRKMNVYEGFDTIFTYEISNPSYQCNIMNDVYTHCRSRGADGFAFVIQNTSPYALGRSGDGLGYDGIQNALAIEFDTYFNYENLDHYENHVSVLTRGRRYNISSNHSYSLATTANVPDLTDGIHQIRIKYDPVFDESMVVHPSFQTTGQTSYFLTNGDYVNGGQGDWNQFGLLYVYVDDMESPILTTPLNIDYSMILDSGRAYVGFTASTGDNHWQAHDIISWNWRSLHGDIPYVPPLRVNDDGDYRCVNDSVCVHRVDYDHYMRMNKNPIIS